MRSFKQIRSLLAGLGAKGGKRSKQASPPASPLAALANFLYQLTPTPYAKFLTHKLSIKWHRVVFMRVVFYCLLRGQVSSTVLKFSKIA